MSTDKLKQYFENLPSEKKQLIIKYSVAAAILAVVVAAYYGSGEADRRSQPVVEVKKEGLSLGTDLLVDDIQEKVRSDLKLQNDVLKESEQRLSRIEEILPAIQSELARVEGQRDELPVDFKEDDSTSEQSSFPKPPAYKGPSGFNNSSEQVESVESITIIGSVGHTTGESYKDTESGNLKKKEGGIYLAPGFMEAQLLHGIEAYTSEGALSQPEPILIRVQAPAVLPNNIKAQLAGCFVLANTHGSLAKERVEGQVVNLSCLSPDGEAVIDQEVLGYVVGSDGKKGLPANIVTKMGQHVGRTFMAGLIGGAGEGVSLAGMQNNITGAGSVQTFDTSKIGQNALGQGAKEASKDIKKLFLELARQTMPVAEVGASAKCTVVLQKGVNLIIRERSIYSDEG